MAESIRRHDTIKEFKHLYDWEPREMVLRALYEWRGCEVRTRIGMQGDIFAICRAFPLRGIVNGP
jgi:hypothetical protein